MRNYDEARKTTYRGKEYRSRLEARWAVFFWNAKIKYEYEKDAYILPNEEHYLPDFWLPEVTSRRSQNRGMFAEIKPTLPTDTEVRKCLLLAHATNTMVALLVGHPYPEFFRDKESPRYLEIGGGWEPYDTEMLFFKCISAKCGAVKYDYSVEGDRRICSFCGEAATPKLLVSASNTAFNKVF